MFARFGILTEGSRQIRQFVKQTHDGFLWLLKPFALKFSLTTLEQVTLSFTFQDEHRPPRSSTLTPTAAPIESHHGAFAPARRCATELPASSRTTDFLIGSLARLVLESTSPPCPDVIKDAMGAKCSEMAMGKPSQVDTQQAHSWEKKQVQSCMCEFLEGSRWQRKAFESEDQEDGEVP